MKMYSHMRITFENFNIMLQKCSFVAATFETDYYIISKFFRPIHSSTVHLHPEFDEDTFIQY